MAVRFEHEAPENDSEFLHWQEKFGHWIQEVLPLTDDEPPTVVADQGFHSFNNDHLLMLKEGHKISKTLDAVEDHLKIRL